MGDLTTNPAQTGNGGKGTVPPAGTFSFRPVGLLGHHRWVKLVLARVATAIVLLLVVSALVFVFISLTSSDEARAIVGIQGSHAQYEHVRAELGLNLSLPAQYWRWLTRALHGNFGTSLTIGGQSVATAVQQRIGVTASLIVGAMMVSIVLGVLFGVISAVRGGLTGRFVDGLALVGFAIPSFWLGAILISIFAVKLGWLPSTGYVAPNQSVGQWLQSLVLPVLALAVGGVAAIAKQARDGMLEALASEHVRAAWASGISPMSIVFRHALRGAALRVIAVTGWLFVSLLGGTVLVESVFALPGLGSLAVTAATQSDIPLIEGIVVCFTVIVVLVNLISDLLYMWFDPRVRVG
jgi:peptide/nickel transport system permease protein